MSIMALITAIIGLPSQINALLERLDSLMASLKKMEDEKWFQRNAEVFDSLGKAKTLEEYQKASKEIQDQIKGL